MLSLYDSREVISYQITYLESLLKTMGGKMR